MAQEAALPAQRSRVRAGSRSADAQKVSGWPLAERTNRITPARSSTSVDVRVGCMRISGVGGRQSWGPVVRRPSPRTPASESPDAGARHSTEHVPGPKMLKSPLGIVRITRLMLSPVPTTRNLKTVMSWEPPVLVLIVPPKCSAPTTG